MKQLTNSKERQFLASQWRLTILWPFLTILACLALVQGNLHASEVENENTGQVYTDLTVAIAAANPEDTLKLKGTFIGTFLIDKSLNLIGHHHATLDGIQSGTVLTITGDTTFVNLKHLTIKNGLSSSPGGGILNDLATTTLEHVEISHNTASAGGGIANQVGTLTLHKCKIHNNTSETVGGGIASFGGGNIISDTKISFNSAGIGGGFYNSTVEDLPSVTSMKEVELEGNFAVENGGGIANTEGSILNFTESEIEENTAEQTGGGLYNVLGATANLGNSKVTKNNVLVPDGGGGIFSEAATLNLTDTEVEHNIPNNITEL